VPVAGLRPGQPLVVERQVPDLGRDRVDEPAGQALGEEAGQQEIAADPRPDRRLVGAQPVGFAVGLERGHGPPDAEGAEGQPVDPADLGDVLGAALVEPDDRRSERSAGVVGHDDRRALGRERHAGDRVAPGDSAGPERVAGLADRAPVQLRILLGPARLR
jgi:hypothetical protein